jgi:hypothetical protein
VTLGVLHPDATLNDRPIFWLIPQPPKRPRPRLLYSVRRYAVSANSYLRRAQALFSQRVGDDGVNDVARVVVLYERWLLHSNEPQAQSIRSA